MSIYNNELLFTVVNYYFHCIFTNTVMTLTTYNNIIYYVLSNNLKDFFKFYLNNITIFLHGHKNVKYCVKPLCNCLIKSI